MDADKIKKALVIAEDGCIDGGHHKMWVIDQMIRVLTDCPIVTENYTDGNGKKHVYKTLGESEGYKKWVAEFCKGEDGAGTYEWDIGIAP